MRVDKKDKKIFPKRVDPIMSHRAHSTCSSAYAIPMRRSKDYFPKEIDFASGRELLFTKSKIIPFGKFSNLHWNLAGALNTGRVNTMNP